MPIQIVVSQLTAINEESGRSSQLCDARLAGALPSGAAACSGKVNSWVIVSQSLTHQSVASDSIHSF
jgi:hypothetical protein